MAMLSTISTIKGTLAVVLPSNWEDTVTDWGERIALYRQYVDGEHRADMTSEMRDLLRIRDTVTQQFNANYADMVVSTMADRLEVTAITGDDDAVTEQMAGWLAANRFDALQIDVHDAALGDGDTFVMVDYDNDAQRPGLYHEPAWDGETGVIPIYDRMQKRMLAAVKVWYEDDEENSRYNVYYPDRVEKYDERNGLIETVAWTDKAGEALGVPLVHFRNRQRAQYRKKAIAMGRSELRNVIPLQDSLNRTLVSMVMTAELMGFPIRWARGFKPPSAIAPGMFITIGGDGLDKDQIADVGVMEQAEIMPFIDQARFCIDQIGTVSQTPLPQHMGGDSASGEALKQRETGLLGKVRRTHVKFGNAWEDVAALALRLAGAFATVAPAGSEAWSCEWRRPEMRSDAEVIANAVAVRDDVGETEFLRMIAPVFDWNGAKVDRILAEKRESESARLDLLAGSVPALNTVAVPA
jgi:hypothetical protein